MNKYIGVDLGTSSSKFLLVDIEGNVDKQCSRSYPVFYPQDGWSEQDPSLWIEALISGVKELTSKSRLYLFRHLFRHSYFYLFEKSVDFLNRILNLFQRNLSANYH